MDVEKQIAYWIDSAMSDLETSGILIKNNRDLNGLFFCHLALEKALKAHFVKVHTAIPPRTHNLGFLLDRTGIVVSIQEDEFMGLMMEYQIEGRYPQYYPKIPSKSVVLSYLEETKRIVTWLKTKL
jgi:HEPN domain-containing protein